MPSHFSTIGFMLDSIEKYVDLAKRISDLSEYIQAPHGSYGRWRSASNCELWLQLDSDNNFLGMNPHFSGDSSMRVGITETIKRPNGSLLDGAFYGWADPAEDDSDSGYYPFVFDTPDFDCHSDLPLPSIVTVQVCAFAHEVSVFESESAYQASQKEKPSFASKSFIPAGLFQPGGEDIDPPEAEAIFTGHILQAKTLTNELTKKNFFWALVDTLGGTIDVVIDPQLIGSSPQVGGILSGMFWLSGRILACE
jgi:hypothetical protein